MKKNTFYFMMVFAAALCLYSCKPKEKIVMVDNDVTGYYNYEATIVEVGARGTAVVKAWGTAASIDEAKEDAKRNAVRAILFKGFPNTANVNSTDLHPMVTEVNAERVHRDYFAQFFKEGGKYSQYVWFADPTGNIATGDLVRKGTLYKVGMVVIVDKFNLRKELESAGVVKKFGIN